MLYRKLMYIDPWDGLDWGRGQTWGRDQYTRGLVSTWSYEGLLDIHSDLWRKRKEEDWDDWVYSSSRAVPPWSMKTLLKTSCTQSETSTRIPNHVFIHGLEFEIFEFYSFLFNLFNSQIPYGGVKGTSKKTRSRENPLNMNDIFPPTEVSKQGFGLSH